MHSCTGTEALSGHTGHRGSGGIALLFLDHGTRRGWGVTPWPLFTSGKDPVPIVQEAGWAPEPVWTGTEISPPPDFDPLTVQAVASRYTVWAILAILLYTVEPHLSRRWLSWSTIIQIDLALRVNLSRIIETEILKLPVIGSSTVQYYGF